MTGLAWHKVYDCMQMGLTTAVARLNELQDISQGPSPTAQAAPRTCGDDQPALNPAPGSGLSRPTLAEPAEKRKRVQQGPATSTAKPQSRMVCSSVSPSTGRRFDRHSSMNVIKLRSPAQVGLIGHFAIRGE
jgi:hypothetical protein